MSENIQDKYRQVLNESKVSGDDAAVTAAVADILAKHFDENNNATKIVLWSYETCVCGAYRNRSDGWTGVDICRRFRKHISKDLVAIECLHLRKLEKDKR